MRKLGIFDVDYTITKRETLQELYKFAISEDAKKLKYAPRAIFSGLMYVLGRYDEKKVKEKFLKFLDGIDEKELEDFAYRFYEKRLKKILYKDSLDMMRRLKKDGYDIYLISASPEFYLHQLYNIKEVDKIIGTKFSINSGKFSGRMLGKNCKGEEKVHRLKEILHKEKIQVDFSKSYMFSDSLSDKPLLDLVGNPYLINYKKKNKGKFKILNWR